MLLSDLKLGGCVYMDALNELLQIFNKQPSSISERPKILELSFNCIGDDVKRIKTNIDCVINRFPARDKVMVTISTITDVYYYVSNYNLVNNITIDEFLDYIESDEEISVKVVIEKTIKDNTISVYKFGHFITEIVSKNLVEFLNIFGKLLKDREYLIFEVFDGKYFFSSNTMIFKNPGDMPVKSTFKRNEKIESCKKTSCFYNISEYELIPDDFNFITNFEGNPLEERFSNAKTILSLIYLANSAFLIDGKLALQISGHKNITCSYDLTTGYEKFINHEIYNIYNWIYTDGNPVDKAIIARNIISLHCKYVDLIDTDEKTFPSIQSNYSVYQKNNVSQYIDLKNKLADQIVKITSQSGDIVMGLVDRIKNNLFANLTFLATAFLTKVLSGKEKVVFTSEITWFSYIILIGSLAFVGIGSHEVRFKLKKLRDGYSALKDSYLDLLDERDIKEIFKDDKVLNDNILEVNKIKNCLVVGWVVFLFLIICIIESYSENPLLRTYFSTIRFFP